MRKNISIDEETINRLLALTRSDIHAALYPSDSEAIRAAVERLWRFHFRPTSEAPDDVLERVRKQLRTALGMVDDELGRRTELEDDEGK